MRTAHVDVARAACLAALLLLAGRARAQDNDFFEQGATYFKPDTIEGVSKHAESPTEAPATVTIVRRDEIERYGFRTLADVLNFASLGDFVTYDRRYQLAGARGLFFAEDFNTRILVMLNGHPLNEPWSNFAGLGREMLLPLDLVDRIEIVYGPSSLLYGGYSLYGIVNVVTRTGESMAGGRVRVSAGSERTGEGVASFGANGVTRPESGAGRAWSILASGGYYSTDGEALDLPRVDVGAPVEQSGGTVWGGSQHGTDFERAPFAFVLARRGDWSLQARLGYRRRGTPFAPYGAVYGSHRQSLKDAKHFVEVRWDHDLGGGLAFSARAFHDRYGYDERDPYADTPTDPTGYDFVLTARDHDTGAELRGTLQRGTHYLTLGGEYRARALDQESHTEIPGGGPTPGSSVRGDATGRFAVVYAQEEWRPHRLVSFVLGGNLASTRPGGTRALPRVAMIVKPTRSLALKALYSEGFRPPSIYEASYADYLTKISNPDLRSERISSTEGALIWKASRRASLQGYVFQSRLLGLIRGVEVTSVEAIQGDVAGPSGDPADLVGQLQYQSTGDVVSSGAGAALQVRGRALQGYLNVAYAHARWDVGGTTDRKRLSGSPHWTASAGISASRGAWTGTLVARALDARLLQPEFGPGDVKGFVEANARLLWRTRVRYPLTLSVDAFNLFDSDGEIAASPVYAVPRLPIEGRRLLMSAEIRF